MKKILTLSFCLPIFLCGQITIRDNFTDGDLTQNPQWMGQDSLFHVNPYYQLQLNDSIAGETFLCLPSKISINAHWEFYLKMDFNPSSSNYAKIYLISDKPEVNDHSKGYFLRVGGSSADKLSLYRSDGAADVLLVESPAAYLNLPIVELRIKVSRDSNMVWKLQSDTGAFVNPYITQGSVVDSTYKKSAYFGFSAKYTISRSDKFYLDDILLKGDSLVDKKAPVLDSVYARTNRELNLFFDEELNPLAAGDPSNYIISQGIGTPISAIYNPAKPGLVKLQLNTPVLHTEAYIIQLQGISDKTGNISHQSFTFSVYNPPPELVDFALTDSITLDLKFSEKLDALSALDITNYFLPQHSIFPVSVSFGDGDSSQIILTFKDAFIRRSPATINYTNLEDKFGNKISGSLIFTSYDAAYGDILINEIMADPTPVIGIPPNNLPEAEYLELFNPNPFAISLKGWNLKIGEKDHIFSKGIILPDSFLVICKDVVENKFPSLLPMLGMDISSLALTNNGAEINLMSAEGVSVNNIYYTTDWYKNTNKKNGGWSLERIDPFTRCEGGENWKASESSLGGTPGYKNSVSDTFKDTIPPYFEKIQVHSSKSIILNFSESLGIEFLSDSSNFIIADKYGNKFFIEAAKVPASQSDKVQLYFKEEMDPLVVYTLKLKNYPSDCNGNSMLRDSLLFTLPSQPESGEILINEVLFNPFPGGVDFVELYNASERFFDLSKLRIGNWNSSLGPENIVEISSESTLFAPGEYLAFTTDKEILEKFYQLKDKQNVIEIASLPSMSDDKGSISISTSTLNLIDAFNYDKNMHLSFISNAEGISLERISLSRETNDANNWTSTSASAGFATPAYKNSQMLVPQLRDVVNVEPRIFHPEMESVALSYKFEKPNNVLSISIWNAGGSKLRDVVINKNVGQEGFFSWDGTDKNGLLQQSGIYIVVFDFYNESGQREVIKKSCVVSL